MSRLLADLLGAPEPAFTLSLRRLEQASGCPGADIRLGADVLQRSQQALRAVGLDPHDTTPRELYRALMLKVEQDERRLRQQLGGDDATSLDKLVPSVVKALNELHLPRNTWALKPSVAKKIIQSNPPKILMKQLRYRSVDSMLKRELLPAVLLAAFIAEGSSWRARLDAKYRQLNPTDCEVAKVQIVALDNARWRQFFAKYPQYLRQLVVPVPELGALVVLPMEATVLPGAALALLLSMVYHINKVRSLSAHVKLQQVKPQFGQQALEIWRGRAKPLAYVADQPLYWDVVHHHFGHRPRAHYPSTFDPHLQTEDLHSHSPEEVLMSLDPELGFWHLASHSGLSHAGQAVSLQALDAALSYCNKLPFENRSLGYIQDALQQELLSRYLRQPHFKEQLINQLETAMPEMAGLA